MLTTDDPLLLRHQDARGVITLTLNRPQAFNALSEAMLDALQLELDAVAGDSTVRLLVIKASGKAFCAGHDLKEMRAVPSSAYYESLFGRCGRMMMSLQRLPVPVIAQVQGIATAAGCQLVAMCDLAVGASDARFAVSGVNLGLFCATPSVALSRNLGRKQAFEMLVTGAFISADDAKARGLVNRVVPSDSLATETQALAAHVAGKLGAALRIGKRAFYEQIQMPVADAYDHTGRVMVENMLLRDTDESFKPLNLLPCHSLELHPFSLDPLIFLSDFSAFRVYVPLQLVGLEEVIELGSALLPVNLRLDLQSPVLVNI